MLAADQAALAVQTGVFPMAQHLVLPPLRRRRDCCRRPLRPLSPSGRAWCLRAAMWDSASTGCWSARAARAASATAAGPRPFRGRPSGHNPTGVAQPARRRSTPPPATRAVVASLRAPRFAAVCAHGCTRRATSSACRDSTRCSLRRCTTATPCTEWSRYWTTPSRCVCAAPRCAASTPGSSTFRRCSATTPPCSKAPPRARPAAPTTS